MSNDISMFMASCCELYCTLIHICYVYLGVTKKNLFKGHGDILQNIDFTGASSRWN
jgi:hypothetical protein